MPAVREGRAQWVLKTSSSPLAEPSSAREADRLLPEGHQAVTTPATQYAVLQGFLTGATGLEPATSGVTGRRSQLEARALEPRSLDDRGEALWLVKGRSPKRLKLQAFCKQRTSAAMSSCSASMQRPDPDLACSLHFCGTRRNAATPLARLITRRSQVQILPPLLRKALETAPFAPSERLSRRTLPNFCLRATPKRCAGRVIHSRGAS